MIVLSGSWMRIPNFAMTLHSAEGGNHMTIQQVVAALQEERQMRLASRFPCRAIMVKNIERYCQLLSELKKISDIRVVKADELFSGPDVMPNYENLKNTSHQNEWVILTGVSEYLRLFSKKEVADKRFASLWSYQAPASSMGRIIIPLWGCEAQWFDTALNLNGDPRQQDFYYDCLDSSDDDQEMRLLVLSGAFEQYLEKMDALHGSQHSGLQEWFEYWENPSPTNTDFVLLTKRSKSIITTNGKISVHVINDMISFIRENLSGGDVLNSENCTSEMQTVLLDYALKGVTLDSALREILNITKFSGVDIMSTWNVRPTSYKQSVALWFELHPDNSYLNHCFAVSKKIDEIPLLIGHEIFKLRITKPDWTSEYKELASVMKSMPDDSFFREIDAISEYETRLDFITNLTQETRIYLLHMVGQWLRKDPMQAIASKKLGEIYPELSAYLSQNTDLLTGDIGSYMARYKAYKLENTLPNDEELYFNGTQTDFYDYRYSILSDFVDSDTIVLWIDALGVEWMPLLQWSIRSICDATVRNCSIAQATLPTETCFNDQWKSMDVPYKKLDKLDKLAHKGVVDDPDYYSCIEQQLTFVAGIGKQVSSLLEQHHRVIITGDHGTSRLAARFFHSREGFVPPKEATVCSHGRYCELGSESSANMPNAITAKGSDGKRYICFSNYDHFRQSGFAAGADDENAIYGEVHGGATPEEMLVPVIVVDSNREVPLTASWAKDSVKISMKKATLGIKFNKAISQLIVKVDNILGEVSMLDGGTKWRIVLKNIKDGVHSAEVYADGHIVVMPELTIIPALGGGDGDLP